MQKKDFAVIKKYINDASNVFVMGHKSLDLDAFGACIGINYYASINNKDSFIIIDDTEYESSVKRSISNYKNKVKIIKGKKVKSLTDPKSILIIVDTNKYSLFQNSEILGLFNKIIVIDHHNLGMDTITGDDILIYDDPSASSACEIIVDMLSNDKCEIPRDIATTLLSGIVLDTNNFVIKTDVDTYYAAYYLAKCGADSRQVQYILKEDINEYIEMQKVITDVKVVNKMAISIGLRNKIYRREDLAKIADTILLFENIEASFVVGKITSGIGISARSMGNVDVGKILEDLGGGGDNHEAATVIINKSLTEVADLITTKAEKI